MQQRQTIINTQNSAYQFDIIWYFYSHSPNQINEKNTRIIGENYAKLGIAIEDNILTIQDDIQIIFKNSLWDQTALNKIAIFDFHKKKEKLQNRNDDQAWLEKRRIQKLQQTLSKKNQRIQIYFYKEDETMQKLIEKSFEQMKGFRKKIIEEEYMRINQQQWNEAFLFIMKFFSCLTDKYLSKEKQFSKSLFIDLRQQNKTLLSIYMKKYNFRLFINSYLKCLHFQKNCQKIGYTIREIYHQLKKNYQKPIQQLKFSSNLVGWKIITPNFNQFKKYQTSTFCLQKLFGIYYTFFNKILTAQDLEVQNNLIVMKLIIKNNKNNKNQKLDKFAHGYYVKDDIIIVNSMNILKFNKQYQQFLRNLIDQQQIKGVNYQVIKDYKVTIFQFQIISYEELMKLNGNSEYCNWIKKFIRFIKNYLQNYNYQIKLESAYLQSNQFQLAESISKITQDQFCYKIGRQQDCININFQDNQEESRIIEIGNLCKNLYEQKQFVLCLKRYLQKIQNSVNIFEKLKQWQILIQISLINGLKSQQANYQYHQYSKIGQIIQFLTPLLSHQLYKKEAQSNKQIIQKQFNCFQRFCFRKRQLNYIQQFQQYDKRLGKKFFQTLSFAERQKKLRKLKYQFCRLFQLQRKTTIDLHRYGHLSQQLIKLKDIIIMFQQSIKAIQKMIKFGKRPQSQVQIKDKQKSIQEYHKQMKRKWQTISQIKHYPMKQSSLSTKSIILEDQNLQFIDWSKSIPNLQKIISQVKRIQQSFQKYYSEIEDQLQEQDLENIYIKTLKIYQEQIQYLQQNHYCNNSIRVLNIYKKQAQIYYKLRKIEEIQKLLTIHFRKQKRNTLLFKAETYKKAASIYFQMQQFQKAIINIQKSQKFYQKLQISVPKIFFDLFFMKIRAQVRLISINQTNGPQIMIHQKVNRIRNQLQRNMRNWSHLSQNRLKIYQIEKDLISIQLLQLQNHQNKYKHIIQLYQQVQSNRSQYYHPNQSSSVLMYIDIIRIYEEANKIQKCQEYYDKILRAFQQKSNQVFSYQMKNVNWVKNLVLFFTQREKGFKFIQILPAREYIQRCLFEFEQIKKNGKFTFKLRKYYKKVYQIYKNFMQAQLKLFPLKPNINQIQSLNQISRDISEEQQHQKIVAVHYNQIYWCFLISNNQIQKYQQQIKILYGDKFNSIAYNINQLSKIIEQIFQETSRKSIIKLVTNMDYLKKLTQNKEFKILQIINHLVIIRSGINYNSALQQVNLYFSKQIFDYKIDIIKELKQIMGSVYAQHTQIDGINKIYSNVMFYVDSFKEKIHQYHTIVFYSITSQHYNGNQQLLQKLKSQFLKCTNAQQTLKDRSNMNDYLKSGQQLRKQSYQHYHNTNVSQFSQSLYNLCKAIMNCYKKESILYPFINNTLRSICLNIDFQWKAIQKLVYPLYRSIQILFQQQIKQNYFKQGENIILWRKAEMSEIQFQLFQQQLKNKPFLQFLSFISTTLSFQWIIKQLHKDQNKQNKIKLKQCVLFKIEVNITKQFLTSPLNNGFYKFKHDSQHQILFNILNVFQIDNVEKQITIKAIIQRDKINISNQSLFQESFKVIQEYPLRLINLKIKNFSNILQQRFTKHNYQQLFQQIQSSFLKKRVKFQSKKNNITVSTFGILQAYETLGKPKKAVQQIFSQLSSNKQYLYNENSTNIVLRAAENCLKMGDFQQAQEYVQNYLPQFQQKRKGLTQHVNKIKIQDQIFEMKFNLIKLFRNQKIDVENYDKNIEKLEQQIKNIVCLSQDEQVSKKTKEIYLRIHQSISQYEIANMTESINHFEIALNQLIIAVGIVKNINIEQLQREKIIQYCQKIIYQMNKRIFVYSSLNKNFQQDILRLDQALYKTSASLHASSRYNQLQSNIICCQAASSNILNRSYSNMQDYQIICSQYENLYLASNKIEEEESLRVLQEQKTKQKIKQANFQLLGKLQKKKNDLYYVSNKGMQQIVNRYNKMIIKMMQSQIKSLQQDGHTRQSHLLIRSYNNLIKQKLNQHYVNYNQIKNQLNYNIFYCNKNQNQIKHLQICRAFLLMAELQYLKTQNLLIQQSYQIPNKENVYVFALDFLNKAKLSLIFVYNFQKQQQSNNTCCNLFSILKKINNFESKKHKMMRLSDQNLKIHVLDLKIRHGQYRTTSKYKNKQLLLLSLKKLGELVNFKKQKYDVLNQQIFVYQIYSVYGLILPKQIQFSKYFKQFKALLKMRDNLKGDNNIENSQSCLQIFQLLDTNLSSYIQKDDFQIIYNYIEIGTWNCENNQLFWRFIICKFNRIRNSQSEVDYAQTKLNYLSEILNLLLQQKEVKQITVNKIKMAYQRFFNNYIQKKNIKNGKINKLANKIKDDLQKIKQIQQDKERQERRNKFKLDKQKSFYEFQENQQKKREINHIIDQSKQNHLNQWTQRVLKHKQTQQLNQNQKIQISENKNEDSYNYIVIEDI